MHGGSAVGKNFKTKASSGFLVWERVCFCVVAAWRKRSFFLSAGNSEPSVAPRTSPFWLANKPSAPPSLLSLSSRSEDGRPAFYFFRHRPREASVSLT